MKMWLIIVNKSEYKTPELSWAYHSQSGSAFEVSAVFTQGKNAGADCMMHCSVATMSCKASEVISMWGSIMNVSARGGGRVSFMSASLLESSLSDSVSDSSLSFTSSCSHYSTQHTLLNISKFHGWPVYVLRASGLALQSLSIIGWNPHWQVRKFVPGVRLGHHCQNFPGNFRGFLNY